ncbi:hypothetical protein F53441_1845 [Fusarium austroafricanum]|uniref:Uncharacterized protein n=1 Tax=Fusarium austroafricanum TaxID=2364996 RepID=A0A8H4KV82_9HYPO|nr:hypothetical protein F53441_1845 [Fusarium austroafricanum]
MALQYVKALAPDRGFSEPQHPSPCVLLETIPGTLPSGANVYHGELPSSSPPRPWPMPLPTLRTLQIYVKLDWLAPEE